MPSYHYNTTEYPQFSHPQMIIPCHPTKNSKASSTTDPALAPKMTPHHVKLPLRARRARAQHGPCPSNLHIATFCHRDRVLTSPSVSLPLCDIMHAWENNVAVACHLAWFVS